MGNHCVVSEQAGDRCMAQARLQTAALQRFGCGPCGTATHRNRPVSDMRSHDRAAPLVDGCGRIHMVICALDYSSSRAPLTCTADGHSMLDLAQACGADSVQVLHEQQCTKENIAAVMRYVGLQCGPDDYVIFYFSGRSTCLTASGKGTSQAAEKMLCLVDAEGQVTPQSFLRAADLSHIIKTSLPQEVRVVILLEGPHVADLSADDWTDREAISIAGCMSESEEANLCNDTSSGGAFTHSLFLAIERLQRAGEYDYSVAMLYNTLLEECNRVFNRRCELVIQPSVAAACNGMAWPLIPQRKYKAPLTRIADVADRDAEDRLSADPKELLALGIRPDLLQAVRPKAISRNLGTRESRQVAYNAEVLGLPTNGQTYSEATELDNPCTIT